MTIWEKVIVNVEKGAKRVMVSAALVSERVKAEIALARLRIRLDEVQALIREQERIIGRTILDLMKSDELPKETEQLLKDEKIVAALAEVVSREKDLDEIYAEIAGEQASFRSAEKARREPDA